MNPEEDDEENEKSIWKFEKITTRWWFYFKNILLFYLFCGAQYIDHATNITYLKISGLKPKPLISVLNFEICIGAVNSSNLTPRASPTITFQ